MPRVPKMYRDITRSILMHPSHLQSMAHLKQSSPQHTSYIFGDAQRN